MGSRGRQTPLASFWEAVRHSTRGPDHSRMAGGDRHLTELFLEAGIREMTEVPLPVAVEHATFAAQWEPLTLASVLREDT